MVAFTTPDQMSLDRPSRATAVAAASTANVSLITITLRNHGGKPVPYGSVIVYLSDSALGAGPSAATASGAVTVGATGALLGTLTAKQSLLMQAGAAGTLILSITDTAKSLFKICVMINNMPQVLATLATADYGA